MINKKVVGILTLSLVLGALALATPIHIQGANTALTISHITPTDGEHGGSHGNPGHGDADKGDVSGGGPQTGQGCLPTEVLPNDTNCTLPNP